MSIPSQLGPKFGFRILIPSMTTVLQLTGRSVQPAEFVSLTPLIRTLRHSANSTIGEGRRLLSFTR